MLDRLLGVASAATFLVGTVAGPSGPHGAAAFTFADPQITESSGLVVRRGLAVTTNDSGDSGRVFVVDTRTGETVGTTSWRTDPVDVEALAPAGPGEVWVGDIGDNSRGRDDIEVLRVPVGRGERRATPAAYRLVYPDRAHDAETLLADPRSGRLFIVTKDVFGGTLYAAPRRLRAGRPNPLRAVGSGYSFATDGAFFPDGRHYVVRGYAAATVYTFPGREAVGSVPLPAQQQGEGIAVGSDGRLWLSTEGVGSDVLRIAVPPRVARAMRSTPGPSASATPAPAPEPADPGGTSWPWWAGGAAAVVFVAVLARLLLRRGEAS